MKRLLYIFWPTSRLSWVLLAVFVLMFFSRVMPLLSSPKGLLVTVFPAAVLVFLINLVPVKWILIWVRLPPIIRGSVLGFFVYAVVVTLGNFDELYNTRLWLNFLFLRGAAPFTSVHTTAVIGAAFAYTTQANRPVPLEDHEEVIGGIRLQSVQELQEKLKKLWQK